MSTPSLDVARCRVDGCDWNTLTSTGVYDELREHLQDAHGYSDEEWQQARTDLMEAKHGE